MFSTRYAMLLALSCGAGLADTIQLKDEAAITGRVVAEKSEHIAVDVGYTILMVPRSAVIKVEAPRKEKEGGEEVVPTGPNTTPPASAQLAQMLYQNPGALRKESTVRELVAT